MHLKSVLMIVFLALTAFIGWQAWTYLNDALTILSDGAGARPPGTQEALALIRDAGLAILALIVLIAVGAGGVIFFFRHLSKDLVATETVLRDSDFRFRDTIENINEAFALFDVQDRLVMCNYRFLETYKSLPPREDMIGKKFEDLMRIVLDAGEIADALALSDPEKWLDQRIERHLHPPTASIEVALTEGRWLQSSERPTRDGGIVSIEADITALKRQELIIERSKAQFQSVVDEQTELICRFLPDKTLTLVNLPFASFYGKTPNSMIGTKLTGLLLEKGTQLLPGMMEPISKDNPVMEVEQEIDMPDGSRNWFWWRCRGFFNAAGNLTEYQCVGSNITTMKRQQEQLQQKEESLTQHIRDLEYSRRMLQEQGEQLVILADEYSIQKDRAEAANSAKSDFLSSMSHELRTPLNAILGFSQLLSNDPSEPLTAAQKDYVEQILKGGEHLLGLINEVLDLAKVESGKVSLSIEEVDPAEVIDQSLIMTYTQAENRNISIIDKTTDSDLPKVWADFTRFKQVLLNLLSNAVKYNKEGGEILLESSEVEDGLLRFSVTDTGRGIPKSKQKDIFQPFSRLGAEATDIEGTGIGLTITKQLVELMNGRIGFNSEQGKGSTFWMELPTVHEGVFDTDEIEMLEVDSHVLNSSVEFSDGSERTLLYVEDNPANLKLVERIVSKIPNIKMLSANNAERGLQIAMTHRPDVIILDINLPGMNGYEALERLHASEITSNIPVIALSASAMIKDVEKGTMAGFHTYLTKPIKIDEVINAIKSALLVQA